MLGAFAQAFRTPDLRRKLLFTLFIMAAFRLGSFIPTPGVDSQAVQRCMAQESQASLLDLVTDCEIASHGDMSASSPERYQLYFYAGAFYNVLICWLESGMKESPAAMADEFARMLHGTR